MPWLSRVISTNAWLRKHNSLSTDFLKIQRYILFKKLVWGYSIKSYVLAFSCHVQLYFSTSGHQTNPGIASNRNSTSNYKATYSCQEGYLLTLGDRVRTCGVLGDWRGRQPLCRCIKI